MKRRQTQSRRFSQIMVWIISILVVISMAVGFLLMVLPQSEPPNPLPTVVIVTTESND